MTTKIRDLGQVRDLLAEWDLVRQHILAGKIAGFQAMFSDIQGRESVYLGGVYRQDTAKALSAALRLSAARMMAEDEPILLKAQGG